MADPLAALQTIREDMEELQAAIGEAEPELWEAYRDLEVELPKAEKAAKEAARKLGPGKHELGPIMITVSTSKLQAEVDLEGLLEEAQARGDVDLLIRMGVLQYTAAAHQILRLPAELEAVYKEFVRTKQRAASVRFK